MVKTPRYQCLCCGTRYEVGNHIYPVSPVQAWGAALICDRCRNTNSDGIVPSTYPLLIAHLKLHGVTPVKNERGWWPIPQ